MDESPFSRKMFRLMCGGLLWYISSIIVNIAWKKAFQTHPCVVNLTLIQLAIAEIVSILLFLCAGTTSVTRLIGILKRRRWDMFITGSFFALGQLCTNGSFAVISISSTHIIKITEPIIALVLGKTILKDDIPKSVIFYICLILAGVAIATVNDVSVSPQGILLAGLSNVGMQARNLYIKLMISGAPDDLDNITCFLLSNFFSLIAVIFLSVLNTVWFGSDHVVFKDLDYNTVVTGICLAFQHVMSILVLQNVFISTHALLNVIKRLLIIVISAVVMHTTLSMIQTLGIGMALTGFYLYTLVVGTNNTQLTYDRKLKLKVTIFCILCFGSFSALHYGKLIPMGNSSGLIRFELDLTGYSGLEMFRNDTNISFESQITAVWSYTRDLHNSSLSLLSNLNRMHPHRKIAVYCGSSKCMDSIKHLETIEKKEIRVLTLANETPIFPWAKRHALIKILTGPAYEGHLQKAIQLAFLWKYGGTVLDLDLNVTQEVLFLSKAGQLEQNSCVFASQNVPLALCNLQRRHPFVDSLMKAFVSSFNVKHNQFLYWPHSIDFDSVLHKTISKFGNSVPKDVTKEFLDVVGHNKISSKISKFGMIHYITSENIGDQVQNIAAAHFLPYINKLLPRDKKINVNETTTVIMNAFWSEESWLLSSRPKLCPIQVSMHLAYTMSKQFENEIKSHKDSFLPHGVVGARDTNTQRFLNDLGIPAKMTGCLTLFFQNPFANMPRLNSTYLVDVGRETMKLLPSHVLHKSTEITHEIPMKKVSGISRYLYAYKLIERYARAKLVITTRIHCALPCVALGTPVIFLNLKNLYNADANHESPRVSGLTSLFHTVDAYRKTQHEMKLFLRDFNYTHPPPNPNKELADALRRSAWSFLKVVNEIEDVHNMYDLKP